MVAIKDLLSGGGVSFPFVKPGDKISGIVVKAESVPQREINEDGSLGEIVYWDAEKTQVKEMIHIVVQTGPNFRDRTAAKVTHAVDKRNTKLEAKDGRWNVYYSGNKFTSLQRAVKTAGAEDIVAGDFISTVFTEFSDRPPKNRTFNPAQLYETEYVVAPSSVKVPQPTTEVVKPTPAVADTVAQRLNVHGPKPDSFPQAAWDVMNVEARAALSPPVAETAAAHGPKPDSFPQAAWDLMNAEARATLSPPAPAGPAKPDAIPQKAWDQMDAETRKVTAAAFAAPV